MTAPMQPRITALTGWRGVVALGIVAYHAAVAMGSPVGDRVASLKIGVTFFFVLSGFVLTYSWSNRSTLVQWQHRAARIVPLYVLAWLLTLAGRSFLHWESTQTELLATLLLVQAWVPSPDLAMAVNPVGWSLSIEVACYLLLPFAVPWIRAATTRQLHRASCGVVAWLAAGALLSLWLPLEWWVGYRASEFAVGVLAAEWFRRRQVPARSSQAAAVLGSAALLVGVAMQLSTTLLDLAATPVVVWLVCREAETARARAGRASPSALARATGALGRWSYALYLSHWIVVVLFSRYYVGSRWIPAAVLLSVVVAAVLHRWVERPAERYLRTLRAPTRSTAATPDLDLMV